MDRLSRLEGPAPGIAAVVASGIGSAGVFVVIGPFLPMHRADVEVVVFLVTFGVILTIALAYSWGIDHVWRRTHREAERAVAGYKSEFAARLSHELRTSLTGIVGYAQLVDPAESGDDNAEALRTVIQQSVQLSRVVDDLTVSGRIEADELRLQTMEVEMLATVQATVDFSSLGGDLVFVDCDDAVVLADPEALRHVLRNLIGNALRHGLPPVEIRGRQFGERYLCQVVDHGPGLGEGVDPLAKGDDICLGLYVARRLAEAMGGELTHRRVRGETHFILMVPMAEARPDPGSSLRHLRSAIARLDKEDRRHVQATRGAASAAL